MKPDVHIKALDFKGFLRFMRSILTLLILLIALLVNTSISYGQTEEQVYSVVEVLPEYPGGDEARNEYLVKNIRYPKAERKNGIQGLVIIQFIVEKDGSLTNIRVLKGENPNLNQEAMRVIKEMPSWKPGSQNGENVRVYMNLPIRFSLKGGNGDK